MFFIMVRDIRGLFLPYGFLSNKASVGGSVAKASEAKVSIMRLTHNICTAFRGESCGDKLESYIFPRKRIVVRSFTVISPLLVWLQAVLKMGHGNTRSFALTFLRFLMQDAQWSEQREMISLQSCKSGIFTITQFF